MNAGSGSAPSGARKAVGTVAMVVALVLVWQTLDEDVQVFGTSVPAWLFGIGMYLAGAGVVWGMSAQRRG